MDGGCNLQGNDIWHIASFTSTSLISFELSYGLRGILTFQGHRKRWSIVHIYV
jgi:hypothetical protein